MRLVEKEADLSEALERSQSTAQSAFGDGTIFIEKYLKNPRHIEVQILADTHGNCIHLCERECSVQRRHQKLIEESPSPVITPELREKMGAAAVRVAKAANYVNAGTVEFLYSEGNFYFNEVNARLQVEHPITEMVTGIDIVKEQLLIAAGEPLRYRQEDIKQNGWAIECRICVEDPLNNFVPSPGTIRRYRAPGGIGIRVDSGFDAGSVISPFYDSLAVKLCSWGRDRQEAIDRMRRALYEYVIEGVTTNIPFHMVALQDKDFLRGDYSTHFIPEHPYIFKEIERIVRERASAEDVTKKEIAAAISVSIASIIEEASKALAANRHRTNFNPWRLTGRRLLMETRNMGRT